MIIVIKILNRLRIIKILLDLAISPQDWQNFQTYKIYIVMVKRVLTHGTGPEQTCMLNAGIQMHVSGAGSTEYLPSVEELQRFSP